MGEAYNWVVSICLKNLSFITNESKKKLARDDG